MYLTFFGLLENPFRITPDPRYLFMSQSHREAFDCLRYGINERKGFIEVIGGIGTGKTTLCRAILNELPRNTKTAFIFNTSLSVLELLGTINEEFGIDGKGKTRKELTDSLNRFLIGELSKGGNAALIIDEAQNLNTDVLEQIRMLSNLETDQEKLIQIVLVGQPELHEILKDHSLRQLNERIMVRSFLRPLSESDTWAYIHHRLAIAGSKGEIQFTERALKTIYNYSHGNPRKINIVCDRALLIAYTKESFRIGQSHCEQAISEIEGTQKKKGTGRGRTFSPLSRPIRIYLIVLAFLLAFGGGWTMGPWLSEFISPIFSRSFFSYKKKAVPSDTSSFYVRSNKKTEKDLKKGNPLGPEGNIQYTPGEQETLMELFRLFNIPHEKIDKFTSSNKIFHISDVCRWSRIAGLDCVSCNVELKRMGSFQVPCLLEVYPVNSSKRNFLIFKGMRGDTIITGLPKGKEVLLSKEYIQRIWFGSCLTFYPLSNDMDDPVLKEGMRHSNVMRLQEQLSSLRYYEGIPSGIFDDGTKMAVMRFQRDYGILPDGAVGRRTKSLLFHITGKPIHGEKR